MDTKEKITVMQAFVDGKFIQFRMKSQYGEKRGWAIATTPTWNWVSTEFRIKPEPEVLYVNYYGNGRDFCAYSTEERALNAAAGIAVYKAKKFVAVEEE